MADSFLNEDLWCGDNGIYKFKKTNRNATGSLWIVAIVIQEPKLVSASSPISSLVAGVEVLLHAGWGRNGGCQTCEKGQILLINSLISWCLNLVSCVKKQIFLNFFDGMSLAKKFKLARVALTLNNLMNFLEFWLSQSFIRAPGTILWTHCLDSKFFLHSFPCEYQFWSIRNANRDDSIVDDVIGVGSSHLLRCTVWLLDLLTPHSVSNSASRISTDLYPTALEMNQVASAYPKWA